MEKSAVLRTLGFFEYATHIVVLVATPEPKPAVRPGNFGAGKMASAVEFITNSFADFAIWASGRRHSLVLSIVEIVNGA